MSVRNLCELVLWILQLVMLVATVHEAGENNLVSTIGCLGLLFYFHLVKKSF